MVVPLELHPCTRSATVGVLLVGVAVVVADRLSRSIVRPSEELSRAARLLGDGDLATRVDTDGPPELAELARSFNDMAARMRGMIDRERELVADLSHRLRTPLTKLRLDVDSVADPTAARVLQDDLDELGRTVDQLIGEARRSAAGRGGRCDAAAVAEARFDFWEVLADEQDRDCVFDRPDGPAYVAVATPDLEAAVDALIDNVFSHTPPGTPFSVSVAVARKGSDRVVVRVADAGPGLAGADLGRRGTSGAGSTGLGVDIARRTAEDAGGAFDISTPPGGGLTVELTFPASVPEPS